MRNIVFSTGIPHWQDDAVLGRRIAHNDPGASTFSHLARIANRNGYSFHTIDTFLKSGTKGPIWLLSDRGAPSPLERVIDAATRRVCFSFESPLIAHHFYHHVARHVAGYDAAFLFPGALKRASSADIRLHPLFWPNRKREVVAEPSWKTRRWLTMINSNKRAHRWSPDLLDMRHPRQSLRNVAGILAAKLYRRSDPWMRVELYQERLRAIKYFAQDPGFSFYGRGWDSSRLSGGLTPTELATSYSGPVDDKQEVLRQFRFCLCYENTVFPGYITEKIFDAMFAGCIPVYWGPDDIADYVPPEAFVDASGFSSYKALANYLRGMNWVEAKQMLDAAAEFIRSPRFEDFTDRTLANRIFAELTLEVP